MIKSIDDIRKLYKDNEQTTLKLKDEISSLLKEEQGLIADANTAAENGDVDGYMKKSGLLERVRATIHVKRIQVDKAAIVPVTVDEAIKAWASYMGKYEKEFDKKKDALEAACKTLTAEYISLCELQNNALKDREEIASLFADERNINNSLPLRKTIEMNDENSCKYHNTTMPIFTILCLMMKQKDAAYFSSIIDQIPYKEE